MDIVNRAKGDSVSQVKPSCPAQSRTTVSNNIAVPKATTLEKKIRRKIKTEDMNSLSAPLSLSNENDSLERDVVLKSPEKGKDFRQLSKVREHSQLTDTYGLYIMLRPKSRSSRRAKGTRKNTTSSFRFLVRLSPCFLLSLFLSGSLTTTPKAMDGKVLTTITVRHCKTSAAVFMAKV